MIIFSLTLSRLCQESLAEVSTAIRTGNSAMIELIAIAGTLMDAAAEFTGQRSNYLQVIQLVL